MKMFHIYSQINKRFISDRQSVLQVNRMLPSFPIYFGHKCFGVPILFVVVSLCSLCACRGRTEQSRWELQRKAPAQQRELSPVAAAGAGGCGAEDPPPRRDESRCEVAARWRRRHWCSSVSASRRPSARRTTGSGVSRCW